MIHGAMVHILSSEKYFVCLTSLYDGIRHWQVGLHQCQVALLYPVIRFTSYNTTI